MKKNNFGINNLPDKKISEVLLEFSKPVIDQADNNTTEHQLKKLFDTTVGIWNAVVQDKLNGNQKYVTMICDKFTDSASLNLLNTFIDRKNKLFSQDLRMISEFNIQYKNGELHIEAKGNVDDRILNSITKH